VALVTQYVHNIHKWYRCQVTKNICKIDSKNEVLYDET